MFISGVNDTSNKLFGGVNDMLTNLSPVSTTPAINLCHGFLVIGSVVDTGDKFIIGVIGTAEHYKTVLTIPACLDLKMKNKQKFNLQEYSKVHSSKLLTKYEKNYASKFSSFIAGIVDTCSAQPGQNGATQQAPS